MLLITTRKKRCNDVECLSLVPISTLYERSEGTSKLATAVDRSLLSAEADMLRQL